MLLISGQMESIQKEIEDLIDRIRGLGKNLNNEVSERTSYVSDDLTLGNREYILNDIAGLARRKEDLRNLLENANTIEKIDTTKIGVGTVFEVITSDGNSTDQMQLVLLDTPEGLGLSDESFVTTSSPLGRAALNLGVGAVFEYSCGPRNWNGAITGIASEKETREFIGKNKEFVKK